MRPSKNPLFTTIFSAFLTVSVPGQDCTGPVPANQVSVDERLEQARLRHRAEVAAAEEKLWTVWQELRDQAQQAGSREKVVALEAQRREFEATGLVPRGLPAKAYYVAVGRAERALEDALRSAETEFTRTDRVPEANKVAQEAARLRSWREAGKGVWRELGEQLLRNPSAEEAPGKSGALPGWTVVEGGWLRIRADQKGNPGPHHGDWYFSPGAFQRAELQQEVDVRCFARGTDAGKLKLEVRGHLSGYGKQDDAASLIVECLDHEKQVLGVAFSSGAVKGVGWVEKFGEARLPEGTRYVRVLLRSDRGHLSRGEKNNNGYHDDLSLRVLAAEP